MKQVVSLGADHDGFTLKESLKHYLIARGFVVEDASPDYRKGDDYPLIVRKVARAVLKGRVGILICDTGAGMAIAANRFHGIRAVPCYSVFMARHARTDNDANVLCLGQETTPLALAKKIVDAWFGTKFSGAARHKRRIKQIDKGQ